MTEHKCVLQSCCCGCTLRSGSLAIGIVLLVLSALAAISDIYLAINGETERWIDLVVQIIEVIICIVLIQGIRKEHRGMVMVWVWVTTIMVGIGIVLEVVAIILTLNFIRAIVSFLVFGLAIYFILVVRSFGLTLGGPTNIA